MPLVLALEPDPRQAEALTPIVERVGAELVLVGSKDAAIHALAIRVPDLILVSTLLSPPDEAEFTAHLRTLADAAKIQTLTIPMLASGADPTPAKRRLPFGLGRLVSRSAARETAGCDSDVFADEIRTYLKRARERAALPPTLTTSAWAVTPQSQEDRAPELAYEAGIQRPDVTAPRHVETERGGRVPSTYWEWDGEPAAVGAHAAELLDAPSETTNPEVLAPTPSAQEQGDREDDERAFGAREDVLLEEARAERESRDEREIELRAREQAALAEAERERAAREAAERGFAERERAAEARAEAERAEREAIERGFIERERAAEARAEAERAEREAAERGFAERERAAEARAEAERAEREATERGFVERERAAEARAEAQRTEREAAERERVARDQLERAEQDRLAREMAERLAEQEAAREEQVRAARDEAERERLAREAVERAEREQAAREQEERERLAREETERERTARLAAERALEERERAALELAERERLARETAERERIAREAAERELADRERTARELAERERLALEAAERERLAREEAERERAAREQLSREEAERARLAREEAERERLARETAARELVERERLAREEAARERVAREAAERELAERERLAREEAERERVARETAERELAERERLAREEAERERVARETAERERAALEQAARDLAEAERVAREGAERERVAREAAERELAERKAAQRELTHRERRARKKAERERLERERDQQRVPVGPLVLLQSDETVDAGDPVEPAGGTRETERPVVVPIHQVARAVPPAHPSRSGWEEAERELAARQADREHIHRERVVRELTVQAEALAEAVKAAQQLGGVAPAAGRAVPPREDTPAARKKTARSRTAGALQRHPAGPQGGDEPGAGEPLRYDALYAGDDDASFAPEPDGAATEDVGAVPEARTADARAPRQRPAPLAMWAHRQHHHPGTRRSKRVTAGYSQPTGAAPLKDLHALLRELNIPLALAEIGYAAGCRIRRVRVTRRTGPRPVEKDAAVVILSRRALERLRPPPVIRSAPEPAVARG